MTRRMKGFLFAAVAVFALAAGPAGDVRAESGPPVGGQVQYYEALGEPVPIPDVTVLAKGEGAVSLDRFRGKFVVLNFWATWCGPCIRELPSLERLNAALGGEKALVVLISQDRGGFPQTDRFLQRLGVDFPDKFIDEKLRFSRAIGVGSLPTTILIDPDGREVGRLVGTAEWDSPEALDLVNWYVAQADGAS
jgi:thiol-disulfide isomerase/thioredoxin